LVEDAKRARVKVFPVDIHLSEWDCEMVNGGDLRIGFCVVRGINEETVRELIEERRKKPFANLMDFLSRTRLSPQSLMSLAIGEAFAGFGLNQRDAFWEILAYRTLTRPTGEAPDTQMNLFENFKGRESEDSPFDPMNDLQAIRSDYKVYGLSTRGHPMRELRKHFNQVPKFNSRTVKTVPSGRVLSVGGLVIARQRPPNAKGTCFATLEDEEGFLDLVLHSDVFEKYEDVFVNEPFIIVRGKVQRAKTATTLIVHRVDTVMDPRAQIRVKSKDFG